MTMDLELAYLLMGLLTYLALTVVGIVDISQLCMKGRRPPRRRYINNLANMIDQAMTVLYQDLTLFESVLMSVLLALVVLEMVVLFLVLAHSALFWEIWFICMV